MVCFLRKIEVGNSMVFERDRCMMMRNRGTVVDLDDSMLCPIATLQRSSVSVVSLPYAVIEVGPTWQDL
jgi:hypothetical protein